MSEQKRPITQLWNFSPTVAEDSLPNSSVTPPDTRVFKKHAPVDQSRLSPSDPISHQKDGTSTSKLENKSIEQPVGATLQGPYNEFMALDQAGPAMIGSENEKEPSLVAIKRVKRVDESPVNRITPFTSDHLVQIRNMYEEGDEIVIVYETMDVTLRQLTGILQGPLKAFQIAAICKELLDGLSYLHKELAHYHGALNCGTILLDLDGRVKIANIGESFIKDRRLNPESERKDIRSVGSVMMELMEPETFILEPHSAVLKNADTWKDGFGIKDFLAATQHSTLETLKNVFPNPINWSPVLV